MIFTMSCSWFESRPISLSAPFCHCVPGPAASGSQTVPSTASVCFHPHCGSLIKLSNNNRTAERQRPTEEFKNAVTLTNIPLRNDELFEVSGP